MTVTWRLLPALALAIPLGCGMGSIAARRGSVPPPAAPAVPDTPSPSSASPTSAPVPLAPAAPVPAPVPPAPVPDMAAKGASKGSVPKGSVPDKTPLPDKDKGAAQRTAAASSQKAGGRAPERGSARVAIATANSLIGRRNVTVAGVDYGSGCTALVRASLARAGHPLPSDVKDARHLHAFAARSGALRPGRRVEPGDVIFLADRPGGAVAHAGLVARAEPDGTAVVLHRVARGVARVRLNLAWPQRINDPATGRLVNDTLFVDRKAVPAGSLVVDVADLLR